MIDDADERVVELMMLMYAVDDVVGGHEICIEKTLILMLKMLLS